MMKIPHLGSMFVVIILSLSVGLAAAQDDVDVCPAVVERALEATNQLCTDTNRHEACYGHVLVDALPQSGYSALEFNEPGDTVNITGLQSLTVGAMNANSGVWGVAKLSLQANLPTLETQDVTMLVFGDVELENAVSAPTEVEVTVVADNVLSVYTEPTTDSEVKQLLLPAMTVTVVERLQDGSWLRIEDSYTGVGWLQAELVEASGDLDSLNVVDAAEPFFRPMQAFYLSSDGEMSDCAGVPASGLLIQTPEGVGEVSLLINEVTVSLGSTIYVNAQPGGDMVIGLLEGHASVSANGAMQTLTPGTQVTIPMSETMSPVAQPSLPQPYSQEFVNTLPVQSLDRLIVIEPPATISISNITSAVGNGLGSLTGGEGGLLGDDALGGLTGGEGGLLGDDALGGLTGGEGGGLLGDDALGGLTGGEGGLLGDDTLGGLTGGEGGLLGDDTLGGLDVLGGLTGGSD